MVYEFSSEEKGKIIRRFGNDFFEKVQRLLETYSDKWNIEILELVDYFSVNCIFICSSKLLGEVVLKISSYPKEASNEINALKEYGGEGFCKIYDYDLENGAILIERIKPGTRLRDEKSLEKRLEVFSSLFKKIHKKPENPDVYPSYYGWVRRITDFMEKQKDHRELYEYMAKAEKLCGEICEKYNNTALLHGDFHHDNILMDEKGEYVIIDPKGVTGDPIFDIPRFILNEFYKEKDVSFEEYKIRVEEIGKFLEKALGVPENVIYSCVFIETAMANCWRVESGKMPSIDEVENSWRLLEYEKGRLDD